MAKKPNPWWKSLGSSFDASTGYYSDAEVKSEYPDDPDSDWAQERERQRLQKKWEAGAEQRRRDAEEQRYWENHWRDTRVSGGPWTKKPRGWGR